MYVDNKKPGSILFMIITILFLIGALLIFYYWKGSVLTRIVLSTAFAFISWVFSIAANKK
ncbi:MAG: hypothetical protein BGO52_11850 [Sphingobacteriales bacterium 44-61]|nr:MAG: hypothetical protein BGO52_11850 [Sphingobacteriales bacterium 44-61]